MSVTTTITVAAGVFAAGHLGELTRIVPFELADAVLEEEGGLEKRVRLVPSRAGLYFLLAMCLFPRAGYQGVWDKLIAGLRVLGLASPSGKALRDLRRRIGIPPVRRLFEILAGPLGQRCAPGVMFGGYRTVSFDGCKSIKAPDTMKNRAWLGKQKASNGETGYPALALMTLVETGTRALSGAVFGPDADGETGQARELLSLLDESMLLLIDRGFDGGDFLAAVAATTAQFPVRLTSTRRLPVLRHLPDGSFLSVIGSVKVRIITAAVTVTCHDGTTYGGVYRLATTLPDHRGCPADALMTLYHERWEHEVTYLALRHTLLQGRDTLTEHEQIDAWLLARFGTLDSPEVDTEDARAFCRLFAACVRAAQVIMFEKTFKRGTRVAGEGEQHARQQGADRQLPDADPDGQHGLDPRRDAGAVDDLLGHRQRGHRRAALSSRTAPASLAGSSPATRSPSRWEQLIPAAAMKVARPSSSAQPASQVARSRLVSSRGSPLPPSNAAISG